MKFVAAFLLSVVWGCSQPGTPALITPGWGGTPVTAVRTITHVFCGHVYFELVRGSAWEAKSSTSLLVGDLAVPQEDGTYTYDQCTVVIEHGVAREVL